MHRSIRRLGDGRRSRCLLAGFVTIGVLLLCAPFAPPQDAGPQPSMSSAHTDMTVDCGSACPTETVAVCVAIVALSSIVLLALLLTRRTGRLLGVVRRRLVGVADTTTLRAPPWPASPWALCVMRV